MTTTSRKKFEELYHTASERSEFYTMSNLIKETVLFHPSEEVRIVASSSMCVGVYVWVSNVFKYVRGCVYVWVCNVLKYVCGCVYNIYNWSWIYIKK